VDKEANADIRHKIPWLVRMCHLPGRPIRCYMGVPSLQACPVCVGRGVTGSRRFHMKDGAMWQTFTRPALEEGGPLQVQFKRAAYVVNRRTLGGPCEYLAAQSNAAQEYRS
jgi:hypothetical protein